LSYLLHIHDSNDNKSDKGKTIPKERRTEIYSKYRYSVGVNKSCSQVKTAKTPGNLNGSWTLKVNNVLTDPICSQMSRRPNPYGSEGAGGIV
jgi:hypothetical protein